MRIACVLRGTHAERAKRSFVRIVCALHGPYTARAQRSFGRIVRVLHGPYTARAKQSFVRIVCALHGPYTAQAQRPFGRIVRVLHGPYTAQAQRPFGRIVRVLHGPYTAQAQRSFVWDRFAPPLLHAARAKRSFVPHRYTPPLLHAERAKRCGGRVSGRDAMTLSAARSDALRGGSLARRESVWGLIFIAPWFVGFVLFFAGPMLVSLGASFTDLILVRPENTRFVGLDNWTRLASDPLVVRSVQVTASFMLVALPIAVGLPLLMAVLLNSKHLVGKPLFRSLFFLPMLIPGVASAMIWQGILNPHTGWIDMALRTAGLPTPDWLYDPIWVLPSLGLIGTWTVGNAMLLTLAGMQGVPTELYDAAKADGASALYRFVKITIPMISPVIFYNLVLATIHVLQYFLTAYVIYQNTAGPDNAALFYMMNLYKEAFVYYRMGYASAMAWALFAVGLVLTIGLFASARRWVYYAGGDR